MPRKTFIPFLFNKDNLPVYMENGVQLVGSADLKKPDGTLAEIENDPEGWMEALVKYARNVKWLGVFRDMTVPMKFPKDGARIIKNHLLMFGLEAQLNFGMAKLDRTKLPYDYYPWYLGELNFLKYRENKSGITIEVLEGGLNKYLKAYENVEYEIPIDADPEHISVEFDGMELANSAMFAITNGYNVTDPNYQIGNHVAELMVVQKEIQDLGGVYDTSRTRVANHNPSIRATGQYFFKATAAGTINLQWKFTITINFAPPPAVNPAAFCSVLIREIKTDNTTDEFLVLLNRTAAAGIPGTYDVEGSGSIDVEEGDELYFYVNMQPEGSGGDIQTSFFYGGDEPYLKMDYTYRHPPSFVKHLHLDRVLDKLVEKLSGGRFTAKSDFLKTLRGQFAMTSGDALRGIDNAFIKISLNAFFKSLNARWGVYLGIENNVLVIEKMPYFFRDEVIADLGEMTDFEMIPAEDMIYNTISAGYKAQEYKEINGRTEFNQGVKWSTPYTKLQKDFDLVSVVRADPFGMELLRINFGGMKTTDTSSDNDSFFTSITKVIESFDSLVSFSDFGSIIILFGQAARQPDFKMGLRIKFNGAVQNTGTLTVYDSYASGADLWISVDEVLVDEFNVMTTIEILSYILNRPAFTSVDGLLHPATTFNLLLSPKRGLLENGSYLRSMLDLMDSEYIKFTSSDKNADLVTVLNGVTVSERADILISSLGPKIFRPYYMMGKTEVPLSLQNILKTNPYGKIKFTVKGNTVYGWLFDGGIKPANNDTQTWKLLSTTDNDFSKIKYESF